MRDASKLYSMGRGKPTKVQTPKGASSIHIHPSMTMYTTYTSAQRPGGTFLTKQGPTRNGGSESGVRKLHVPRHGQRRPRASMNRWRSSGPARPHAVKIRRDEEAGPAVAFAAAASKLEVAREPGHKHRHHRLDDAEEAPFLLRRWVDNEATCLLAMDAARG